MAGEHATTTLIPTATGWPLLTQETCLGKPVYFQSLISAIQGTFTVESHLPINNSYYRAQ